MRKNRFDAKRLWRFCARLKDRWHRASWRRLRTVQFHNIPFWLDHDEKIAIPFRAWGKAVWTSTTKTFAEHLADEA